MIRRRAAVLAFLASILIPGGAPGPDLLAPAPAFAAGGVHTTYMWHMDQPIYWPDRRANADRYEYARESLEQRWGGQTHPENNLDEIFGWGDRVAAYQYAVKNSIGGMSGNEHGAQASFPGNLIENIQSLGEAGYLGYGSGWRANGEAASWLINGDARTPRLDIVTMGFHHPMSPLLPDELVEMEIRTGMQRQVDAYAPVNGGRGPSKGFWPSECAFSERMIPILERCGVEWSFVSNSHISRSVPNFPLVLGSGGVNTEPPNRADMVNPAQPDGQVLRLSIDRGCAPANFFPYAMRPHYAQYVDPATGAVSQIAVVPMEDALSWKDGYSQQGTGSVDGIAWANDPAHPMLVTLAHDGDNAWGGGSSYYYEAVPGFTGGAVANGHAPTTVQRYLIDHPLAADDVVHVEDGPWPFADGDMGSPTFANWNWPLMGGTSVDIENGWAEDQRNFCVIMAGANRVIHATDLEGGLSAVNPSQVMYPWLGGNREKAWHFMLGALNSGYMYYGTVLDMEVKPTIACNEAVYHADQIINAHPGEDATPPTAFIPQRYPYNPGSLNYGAIYRYRQYISPKDFWIYTFAYDVSGIASATLKYRVDADGWNDTTTIVNEIYAGGSGVDTWSSFPMTFRDFPTGNVTGDPSINLFELPTYMADEYYAHVNQDGAISNQLVDYYIELVDNMGNVQRTPIQHVWVGDGSGSQGGSSPSTTWTPTSPDERDTITITKILTTTESPVYFHWGVNQWTAPRPDTSYWPAGSSGYSATAVQSPMTKIGSDTYQVVIPLLWGPQEVDKVDFVFHWGSNWDNNSGADWHVMIADVNEDTTPPAVPTGLTRTSGNVRVDLAWDAVSAGDLAGYTVWRQGPTDTALVRYTGVVASTAYADTYVSNGSVYVYAVSSVDNWDTPNESATSETVTARPTATDTEAPSAPDTPSATKGVGSLTLDWPNSLEADVVSYRVLRYTDTNGTYALVGSPSASTYADSGLSPAVRYYYRIAAVDSSGNWSDSSGLRSDTPLPDPPPAAPTGLTGSVGTGYVSLSWNAVADTDLAGYRIYRIDSGQVLVADTTQRTGVILAGLTNGETHTYKVSAYDTNGGEGSLSSSVALVPQPMVNVQFTVDVSGVAGVTRVNIAGDQFSPAWSTSADTLTLIDSTTRWTITKQLRAGTALQYKFVVNGSQWENDFPAGAGNNREIAVVEHDTGVMYVNNRWNIDSDPAPGSVGGLATSSITNGVVFRWNTAADLDTRGYYVWYSTPGRPTGYMSPLTTAATFTCSNMTAGESVSGRVAVVDSAWQVGAFCDTRSDSASGDLPPPRPDTPGAIARETYVSLSWAPVGAADLAGYHVYYATSPQTTYVRHSGSLVSGETYVVSPLVAGTTYRFVVRAVDLAANYSDTSGAVTATPMAPDSTPPAAPTGLAATPGASQVRLNWNANAETDLAGYHVWRRLQSESTAAKINASVVTETTYLDATATNGNTYVYVVKAADAFGNVSDSSATATATPQAATSWREITLDGAFLDWAQGDVFALDAYDDYYSLGDGYDYSRDLIAAYAAEGQNDLFFRADLLELGIFAENASLNLYVLLDWQTGGCTYLPDLITGTTDKPWEIALCVRSATDSSVFKPDWTTLTQHMKPIRFNSAMDAVEFGISKAALTAAGWAGQAISAQVFTGKDGFNQITDATVDAAPWADGVYNGQTALSATTGTAKWAAIFHANQSINPQNDIAQWIRDDANRTPSGAYTGYRRAIDSHRQANAAMNVHLSGSLIVSLLHTNTSDALTDGVQFLDDVKDFVDADQQAYPGCLVGGVFAEHIMPYFENDSASAVTVNAASIALFDSQAWNVFGIQPKVFWTPERVIRGSTFDDILKDTPSGAATGYLATVLDFEEHINDWFGATGRNKLYRIGGVLVFPIDKSMDEKKFANSDDGLWFDSRKEILDLARSGDQEQIVVVFDDWEAYAGKSFAAGGGPPPTNNNPDNYHNTIQWLAAHPWVRVVSLADVAESWAWTPVDLGTDATKPVRNYQWLLHANENSYDNWYYGGTYEEHFNDLVPALTGDRRGSWAQIASGRTYGDVGTAGSIFYEAWRAIERAPRNGLRTLAELTYATGIYETAWHDENNTDDSRWGSGIFDWSSPDVVYDNTSGWALYLHGQVRKAAMVAAAAAWADSVADALVTNATVAEAVDLDLDNESEYVLRNNRVFAVFENNGGRLVFAAGYHPTRGGVALVGVPGANTYYEGEEEVSGSNTVRRASCFKEVNGGTYPDMNYNGSVGGDSITFVSNDGLVRKTFSLAPGDVTVVANYVESVSGALYVQFGLSPDVEQLQLAGPGSVVRTVGASEIEVRNGATTSGAEAAVEFRGTTYNAGFSDGSPDNSQPPCAWQAEVYADGSFQVALRLDGGAGADTAGASTPPPSPPTGLDAVAGNARVDLTWTASPGPSLGGYVLFRSTDPAGDTGFDTRAAFGSAVTSYADSPATNGTTYWYHLKARSSVWPETQSAASNKDSATPSADPAPQAPAGLVADDSTGAAALRWTTSTETDVAGYRIYRATSATGVYTWLDTNTSRTDTDYLDLAVNVGTTYWYKLSAYDSAAQVSGFSAADSATPYSAGGASADNDIWWFYLAHDPDSTSAEIDTLYRLPAAPSASDTVSIYVRAAQNDLTAVRLRVWNVGTSSLVTPWPEGTKVASANGYDVWRCQIPGSSGQKWYRVACVDGTDTDWIKDNGSGLYAVSDGGEDGDPAGSIDFTYTPAASGAQDNTVTWEGLGHEPDSQAEGLGVTYRLPVAPRDGESVAVYVRASKGDLTGVALRIWDEGTAAEVTPRPQAILWQTTSTHDVWRAEIPDGSADTHWYWIMPYDGTDTDYIKEYSPTHDTWVVQTTSADGAATHDFHYDPIAGASQNNDVWWAENEHDPDSTSADFGVVFRTPTNPTERETVTVYLRTNRDDLSRVTLFVSDADSANTTLRTMSKVGVTSYWDLWSCTLARRSDTQWYYFGLNDGTDTDHLKEEIATGDGYMQTPAADVAGTSRDFRFDPVDDTTAIPTPQNFDVSDPGNGWALEVNWAAVSDSYLSGYTVQRSTAAGGPYATVATLGNTVTLFVDSPLTYLQTYWYRVRAFDDLDSSSAWAGPDSEAPNDSLAPAPPALSSPDSGTTLDSSAVRLDWDTASDHGGSGISYYRVQVSTQPGFGTTFVSDTTPAETTFRYVTGLWVGTWYWRVAAVDVWGNESTAAYRILRVDTGAPAAFVRLAPADGTETKATTIAFSWAASAGADSYTLQVATSAAYAPLRSETTLAATSASLSLAGGETYHWRVIARNVAGNTTVSGPTADSTFLLDTATPAAFSPSAPADETFSAASSIAFSWSASADTASGLALYRLQVSTSSGFASLRVDSSTGLTANSTLSLPANDTYWWRVVAYDDAGNTAAATSRRFRIDAAPPAAPALLAPANGHETSAATVLFDWTDAADSFGVGSYRLVVAGNTTTTTASYASLAPSGETIVWFVQAVDTAGNVSAASETRTLYLDTAAPVIDSVSVASGIPAYLSEGTPVETGVAGDTVWFQPDSGPGKTATVTVAFRDLRPGTFTASAAFGDAPAGDAAAPYEAAYTIEGGAGETTVVLTVVDRAGNADTMPLRFRPDTTSPSKATPLAPSASTAGGTTVAFQWIAASDTGAGVSAYNLQASTSPAFALLAADTWTAGLTLTVALPAVDTYWWRVVPFDAVGNADTASADSRSFRIDTAVPVIDGITAASTTPDSFHADAPIGVTDNGDTVWFGPAAQTVTLSVSVLDDNDSQVSGDTVFGAPRVTLNLVDADSVYALSYTIAAGDGDTVVRVVATDSTHFRDTVPVVFVRDATPPSAAAPASPADAHETRNRQPVLSWSASADAGAGLRWYRVEITSSATFASVDTANTTTATSLTPSARSETTWRWRVVAVDNVGNESAALATISVFTVDTTPPTTPALAEPANATETNVTPLRFSWGASADTLSGVAAYRLQLSTTAAFTAPYVDTTGADTAEVLSAASDTTWWRVVAYDDAGNSATTGSWTLVVATEGPETPTLDAPADAHETSVVAVRFTWLAAARADSYLLRISTSPAFAAPVTETGVTDTQEIVALAPNETYAWMVVALDAAGNSAASTARTLWIDASAPAAFANAAPADTHDTSNTSLRFAWTASADSLSGLAAYRLQVSTGSNFLSVYAETAVVPAETSGFLSLVGPETAYWRVLAVDGAGNTTATAAFLLRIDTMAPTSPALVAPANGDETMVQTLRLTWGAATDPAGWSVRYRLQAAVDSSFAAVSLDTTVSDTEEVVGLTGTAQWYWRVLATDSAGNATVSVPAVRAVLVDVTPPSVFSLSSPSDGLETRSTSVSFAWGASGDSHAGFNRYQLQTSTSSTFVLLTADSATGSATAGALNVAANDTYWWRVVAYDDVGNTRVSATSRTLAVDTRPPSTPALLDPIGGESTSTGVLLVWGASTDSIAGVDSFVVQVDSDPAFGSLDVDSQVDASETSYALSVALDTWYWRVIAVDQVGNTVVSANESFVAMFFDTIPPAAFALLGPAESTVTAVPFQAFSWNASSDTGSGLAAYRLQISRLSTFATLAGDTSTGLATNAAVVLPPNERWYWRVLAVDAAGNTRASTPAYRTVTVDTMKPTAPALLDPTAAETTLSPVVFLWSASTETGAGLAGYRVQVSTTSAFTLLVVETATPPAETGAQLLLSSDTFWWRVVATDSAGNAETSAADSFQVRGTETTAPTVTSPATSDAVVTNGGGDTTLFTVTAADTSGVATVVIDLGMLGGSPAQPLYDTGPGSGDTTAADGIWNLDYTVPDSAMGGTYDLVVTVTDAAGNTTTATITITVTDATPDPYAEILAPASTVVVEGGAGRALTVLVGPDTTLSRVVFEVRASPGGAWTYAGADSTGPIFGLTLNLGGTPLGDHYVRAIGYRAATGDSSPSYVLARVVAAGTAGIDLREVLATGDVEATALAPNESATLVSQFPAIDDVGTMYVPAGARTVASTYRIARRTTMSLGESTAISADRLIPVGSIFDCEVDGVASPVFGSESPVTVAIFYDHLDTDAEDDALGDSDAREVDVRLYYYDVAMGRWLPVAGQERDAALNVVWADVTHFTAFTLFVRAGTATLDGVRIYPNPWVPSDGDAANGVPYTGAVGTGITFDNVPPNTSIEIFDIAGKSIATIPVGAGAGSYDVVWDVRNDSGRDVASGMYLVVLRSGSSVVTRKVMVVR